MITYCMDDLFQSDCEAIVNTVNTQGKMGAGLALQFATRWPEMNKLYIAKCKQGKLRLGTMHVWQNPEQKPKFIINFPTKDQVYKPSKMSYIVDGLVALDAVIKEHDIKSIAIPALGCGLGGLDWTEVKKTLVGFANDHWDHVRVVLYPPKEQK